MNTGAWCLKNKQTAIIIFAFVFILGIISFYKIPRLSEPNFEIHAATIVTVLPGASPFRVEQLVTDKIESALRDIAEIQNIESNSVAGASIITVSVYDKYVNLKPIWIKLRNKIADVRSSLPKEAFPPIINDEFSDVYSILIALRGDGYSYRDLELIANDVRQKLFLIPSVGKVVVNGVQQEKIYVEFSNSRLSAFGFSPFSIANVLTNQNTIASSGNILTGDDQIILETTGEFQSIDALRQMEIQIPGRPESVRLGNLTKVTQGYEDPPGPMARFNGSPALVLGISVEQGGNILEMGEKISQLVDELNSTFPAGVDLSFLAYQPTIIKKSIADFMRNLWEAMGFVFVVMLLFAGLRSGVITGLLIPISLCACLIFLPLFHVDLEQVSIAAMIIALGILVDNGVVVCESMLVRFNSGIEKATAVKQAVHELWAPLLVASLCTIFAFLPIPLAHSAVGDLTYSLFVVLTLSLLFSWIFAMSFIPFLCYYFLKPKMEKQTFSSFFYIHYRKILLWALQNRVLFVGGMALMLVISIWGFKFIPKSFFPPDEDPVFMVELWMPQGTNIIKTSEISKKLETFLLKQSEVKSVGAFIGDGGPRWQLTVNPGTKASNYAFFIVNTISADSVGHLFKVTNQFMEEQFPDLRYLLKKIPHGAPVEAPIQIRMIGNNIENLYKARNLIEPLMKETKGLINIRDDWNEWIKKLVIDVQQRQTKHAGLTSNDIALSLQTQFAGYEPTQLRKGSELIPIVLRSDSYDRNNIGNIQGLNIYSLNDQRSVPLSELAKVNLVWQPSVIRRFDQQRGITLDAELQGRTSGDVMEELDKKIKEVIKSKDWPNDVRVDYRGESRQAKMAQDSIFSGIPISAALLVMTLVAQFNSVRNVLIILLTVPLIMIGITPGLLLTHAQFGFMALLGLISLNGIVVNHAIMMLDRMNIELSYGHGLEDAIMISAQRRFRPILATAVTTSVGLIPLSLEGGEMWRPMANTIIFGVSFSTVLTLVLCPVLYSCFYRAKFKDYVWRPELLLKNE